ncbi:TPA: filamentous hemagglutinin N-terminal domain-containing protein [Burkholderia cenocepacia]|nr:filamentous hemagglutinin N-terminal domain-containing protein [Burkholderia cenocepacia]HDR9885106.1 filamentous hemagglutinin N-terminal domain-containing protein [Burkholderia cenocepacia]
MNSGIFRLVFSAVRGMLVAVDENASAHGGGERSRVQRATRPVAEDSGISIWFAARATAFAVLCTFGMQPLVAEAQATLPITPDRSGPTHPVVGVSASGVPLVNITAPKNGVSLNNFTQYNVGTKGAVLVNSGQNSQTQLAGWVQGNPFLGNSSARVIVNQVTSGNPSQLLGPTEIAGNRANLVIANPAGITCAGCGFLNVPRVTLTTGVPTFNADGTLAGFNVTQGKIGIGGAGLDAHGSAIDLISRAMTINGQVWADSINAVSGANHVDYASNAVQAQAGTGTAPGIAIDVQALGSMFANSVRMIGTEAGVGVRDAGSVTSLTGDIQVSNNGDVTIAPDARIQSAANTRVDGANVTQQGTIVSTQTTDVNASQALSNAGTISSGGNTNLTAAASLNNSGQAYAGADSVGNLVGGGSVTARAASVTSSGTLAAGNNVNLFANDATLDHGTVNAASAINVTTSGTLSNVGGTMSGQNQTLNAGQLINDSGVISSQNLANVTAQSVSNRSGTLTADALSLNSAGALDNTQGHITARTAQIAATDLANVAGEIGTSTSALSITATGGVANNGGRISGGDGLILSANMLSNGQGQVGSVAGDTSLNVAQSLDNASGKIASAHDLTVRTTQLNNSAGTISAHAAQIQATDIANAGGQIGTAHALTVTASGAVSNRSGAIVGGNGLSLTTSSVDNTSGKLGSMAGDTTLQAAQAVTNSGGTVSSAGQLKVSADTLSNDNGSVTAGTNATIQTGDLTNAGGEIGSTAGGLSVTATRTASNDGGKLVGATGATVIATTLSNRAGKIGTSSGDTTLTVSQTIDNAQGKIASAGALNAQAGAFDNSQGMVSADAAKFDIAGALTNTGGMIGAKRDTAIVAQSVSNQGGTIGSVSGGLSVTTTGTTDNMNGKLLASGDTALTNSGLLNNGGTITGANVALESGQSAIDNTLGTVAASQSLTSRSGAFDNQSGLVQATAAVDIDTHGQTFDNGVLAGQSTGGQVLGNGVTLTTGTLSNVGGAVSSSGAATVRASSVVNDGGALVADGALAVQSAGIVSNVAGQIGGNSDVQVSGTTVDNTRGAMHASGKLSVNADTIRNAQTANSTLPTTAGVPGMVAGMEGASVALTASQVIDNTAGSIRADKDATLTAPTIENTSGSIQSKGTATLAASNTLINSQGDINGGQKLTVSTGTLGNDGKLQSAGDVSVTTQGDLTNGGQIVAGHDLTATAGGTLDNSGTLSAGNVANVSANSIQNRAAGEIFGGNVTGVHANQSITNEGLIDGGTTTVTAGDTVTNAGGRIYGDTVAVGANTVINDQNAQGVGGVIASRGDLDIGAQTFKNQNNALIYASNDIRVGGALDGNRQATGSAQIGTNNGAQIDAGRDITISANRFENLNSNFQTSTVTTASGNQLWYQVPGSTEKIDPSTVYLYQKNSQEIHPGTDYQWALDDDQKFILLPSTKYPFAEYAKYTMNGVAGKIDNTAYPASNFATGAWAAQTGAYRTVSADIWATFGVTPPPDANPAWTTSGPFWMSSGVALVTGRSNVGSDWFSIKPPTEADVTGAKPNPLGAPSPSCLTSTNAACAPFQQWYKATVAAYQNLNQALAGYNADVASRLVQTYTVYTANVTSTKDVVTASQPGTITSGRSITINTASGVNDKSQIVAGDGNNPKNVQNIGAQGTETFTGSGQAIYTWVQSGGAFSGDERATSSTPFMPAIPSQTIDLPVVLTDPSKPSNPIKSVAVTTSAAQGMSGTGVTPVAGKDIGTPGIVGAAVQGVGTAPVSAVKANVGDVVVRTVTPNTRLPNNALYQVTTDPGSHFLIETDPRFTNYRNWLSSDTMLDALKVDPNTVLKRIGDGFYEQQLIQQQIIQTTGQRFIGDYTDNQSEYEALMASGVKAGKQFGLNVGTALTEAQMAALTSDIVWLVNQTVTLPNGSQQTVLVPQVYLHANAADVTGEGTIISGKNVTVDSDGAYKNSGTIASRNVTIIHADSIENRGTVAGDTVLASADKDLNNLGGLIQGNAVTLSAGRDLNLTTTTSSATTKSGSATGLDRISTINAGSLQAVAGRNLNANAAVIATTGNAVLAANNDVNLNAVRQSSQDAVKWDDRNHAEHSASSDTGTQIASGGNLAIVAGHDVNATAAYANAQGAIAVSAGHDVNLNAGEQSASANDEHYRKESGFLSSTSTHTIDSSSYTNAVGTTLSGSSVAVQAGNDLTAKAATIAATNDVGLSAGHDLTVTTADTASSEYHYKDVKKSGLGSAGAGISYGTNQTIDTSHDTVKGSQGSLIGSTDGSVSMVAGNKLHVTGSDIVAGQDVTGIAKEVTVDASQTDRHHDETHEVKSSGFTLAVKSPVIDAIQNVNQQAQGARRSQDGRAAALHAIAAAGGMADLVGATGSMTKALNDPNGKPEAKVELSFGSSHSKTTFTEDSTQNNGSSVKAGGTAAFIATGDKNAGQGNVTIQGSDVTAKDLLLQAKNKVNLVNSTDTDRTRSTNESKSASVGVSYGTGGFGVSASMSRAHGDANSDAATQNNTHINASNTATIISGGDTNIIGANVNAKKVIADVGGNLNLASVQDTSRSEAHQSSSGGGFSVSQGGGSASFNAQSGHASGNYAGVNEQSGIQAGDGGFDITVKGNTDLKGAYIASTATPDKNQLTTGTLSFSDIQNSSSYNASSFGLSAGGGVGDGGNNYATHGQTSGKNTGGALPLYVSESGSSDATTKSAISAGNITITDTANQKQDVATLNRDTSGLNGTVSKTPNLQQVLSNQADVISAAQAASEAIAKQIGAYADKKQRDALTAAANETDPKLQAQYLQDAKAWAEGGDNRVALHIAGGALTGGLTGGGLGAAGGAAGAGVSAKLAPQLNELAKSIKDAGPTGNANVDELLGNLASNVLAGGAGALVGGGTGALTGASADRFNRQLSPMEIDKIKALAGNNVDLYNRLIAAACSQVDCSAEFVKGTADFRHYDDMEKLGAQDAQAQKILRDAQASDPTFLHYSLAQQGWDAAKLANSKATQVASWVGTTVSSTAKTVANGVVQGGLQTLDGLSVIGGGVGDPVSEVGQSIQQNGVKQTAVNSVAGFSDTMKAVGQGDPTAVGTLTGSAALAMLTDRVLASSKPGISVDIGDVVGGHSVRDVNSIYPSDGRTMNCANCAVATDATLAGNPATALPGQVTSPADVAKAFGKTPFNWIGRTGPDAIAQTMSNWGDGSRAVVFGARGDEVGHFSNVVNQGGTIRFLDGQTGKPTNLSDGYTRWFILRTDK